MPQTRQQRGQNFPASVSRETSQDRSSETEVDGINLFDYVVDSTLQHDPSNNSFSSSSVTTSSRRGQRSLRVKRYTNDGDEVVVGGGMAHDVRLEAAPPKATHSSFPLIGDTPHAYSSSPLGHPHSPSSNHTSRALRTKRYLHHPSTISSESEDLDEDDNDDDDDNREVEEAIKQQQSERPSLPLLPPPPPPPTSPPDDIDNKLSIASSTDVWMAKVGEKAKSDDDEDDPAPLRRAPENRNRRQAALLASAAIVQKGQLKRKGEEPRGQQSKTETNQNKLVHIKKEDQPPRDPEVSDETRAARIEVLAARKRKLEALANISSTSLGQVGGKPVGREPRRMISLDMHPEEDVEEEIPPASSIVPPSREVDKPSDHPSSVHSETKYDARASNARRRRRLLILLFLLLAGSGIGIYFGIVYGEDEDPERSSEASMSPPTSASSPIASPIPSPTPLPTPLPSPLLTPLPTRWPTPLPSLRPVAAAPTSAPLAQFPSNNPVITAMPSQPSVTIPAGVDSALFSLLLSEWPALNDSIANALSPQMRALLWLSVDEGLSTYSTQRKKQRYALATFFLSTNGQAWRANDGWLSNTDECQWYTTGVASSQCDQEGLYLSLKLNFNDLEGSIPAELALLSASLTSIDLVRGDGDGTFLSGILPSEIGRLEKLAFLNLQGNKLEQSIPTEIGFLTGLRRLQLQKNSLTGPIPTEIGLLTALRELNLSDNLFSVLPSEIGNLSILIDFFASSNILGSIPSEVGNLSQLTSLDLSSNRLSGTMLSELGNLRSLVRMDLSSNALAGSIPSAIGNLDLMVELLLHSNQLTGKVPSSFSSLSGIGTIRIESNSLIDGVPSIVCTQFAVTTPIFVADCDLYCPCCTHCCANGTCQCQLVEGSGLYSLCDAFP